MAFIKILFLAESCIFFNISADSSSVIVYVLPFAPPVIPKLPVLAVKRFVLLEYAGKVNDELARLYSGPVFSASTDISAEPGAIFRLFF